jgi:hypothetical protein
MWQILNHRQKAKVENQSVSELNVNGTLSNDNLTMANHFNRFFTNVGREISISVPPIAKRPDEFIFYDPNIPDMQLGNTTPEHILIILKKTSVKK